MNYFESVQRVGPARIGILDTGKNEIETPSLLDLETEITDQGSLWDVGDELSDEVTISPSKRCPNYVPKDVAKYFGKENLEASLRAKESKTTSPVVGGAKWEELRNFFAENSPKSNIVTVESLVTLRLQNELIKVLSKVREGVSEDTAIFAPGIAVPNKLYFFVYLGVDLFDTTLASVEAARDKYFTSEGSVETEQLSELPCSCSICSGITKDELLSMDKKERKNLLESHNINSLELEIKKIRNSIRGGKFRENLEKQVKTSPYLTAALRKLDKNHYSYLEKRTPTFGQKTIYANSIESLSRPDIKRFRRRVLERYEPPTSDVAILLPCSARKPYSQSRTHQIISSALGSIGNQLIITSPLGIVPRELEITYPAQHYDLPVIGDWLEDEKKMIKRMLESYFSRNEFEKIVVHLGNKLGEITEDALNELDVETEFTSRGRDPRSKKSLKELRKQLTGYEKTVRKYETIESILDYQFGIDTGEEFVKDTEVVGNYPRLKVFYDEQQLGAISPQYGSLSLTIKGARRINTDDYRVKIGSFYPEGSVLAPGVLNACDDIRPNDEVIFEGKDAFGVGRAKMSGFEMIESNRGIAIQTRHVEEL